MVSFVVICTYVHSLRTYVQYVHMYVRMYVRMYVHYKIYEL